MGLLALAATFGPAAAQRGDELEQMRRAFSERNDAALAEPYRGITSGSAERNLFPIRPQGEPRPCQTSHPPGARAPSPAWR